MIIRDRIESRYDPVKVELVNMAECRIVAANRDGTYKILVYDGQKYALFARACVTAFDAYCDSEGEIYRSVSKETWDSWGRDLPEVTDKEEDA